VLGRHENNEGEGLGRERRRRGSGVMAAGCAQARDRRTMRGAREDWSRSREVKI
jgi:hypothetical protein